MVSEKTKFFNKVDNTFWASHAIQMSYKNKKLYHIPDKTLIIVED